MSDHGNLDPRAVRGELMGELERMLREKLAERPDDLKLHVRLAELYYETGREAQFLAQAQIIRELFQVNLDSPDWKQIAAIGRRIAPHSPIFSDAQPAPARPEPKRFRRFGDAPEEAPYFRRIEKGLAALQLGPKFLYELDRRLIVVCNRPSSLLPLHRWSEQLGGARILLKREDQMQPGTPLIAAVAGQILLAQRLGYSEVVTGSVYGQKGIVMASLAAHMGMRATIFMDSEDTHQQSTNVLRMWACGAVVETLEPDSRTRDVRQAALRYCMEKPDQRFLVMGLESGPPPYPKFSMDCVGVVGREVLAQCRSQFQRAPDLLVARGLGTADAFSFLSPFKGSAKARLVCVNPKLPEPEAKPGRVQLTGSQRDLANAIMEATDYPAVEREHAEIRRSGRVEYVDGDPEAGRAAIRDVARMEGVILPMRTAQAVAYAAQQARTMPREALVVVNLVERADKDIWDIGDALGLPMLRQ